MKRVDVAVIVGTRPEIIKMAPVIKELSRSGLSYTFILTGQHYDYEMSSRFVVELELPKPDTSFVLGNSSPASQIGEIMIKMEEIFGRVKPSMLLVQGDTNSTLAASIACLKLKIKLGHVEAGLRSYDWRMPEEHNRRMVDHVSDYLFAPTGLAAKNLREENVWGEVYVTGNTIIDALEIYFDRVRRVEEKIMGNIDFDEYILVTLHRSENVDNYETLRNLVMVLKESPLPIVFPIHPRTKRRLNEYGLMNIVNQLSHVSIMPPLGYFEFLALMKNSKFIMTDSGGVVEEATHPYIRKYTIILRNSTERPEAVSSGFAIVAGVNPVVITAIIERIYSEEPKLPDKSPFGDGSAAIRIVKIVKDKLYA